MIDQGNKVLRRADECVTVLSEHGPLTAPDLASHLGIPRPSAYRLASALVHSGLADQDDAGMISLSTKWLWLGDRALASAAGGVETDDALLQLRDATGLTVFLALPRAASAVCIRTLHGDSFQILVLKPGGELSLHLGAVGRVVLAYGPQDTEAFLQAAPHPPATPHSLVAREELEADVLRSREQGYTVSDEDVTIGVAAIGVPILDAEGALIAAVSVAGRREDVLSRRDEIVRELHTCAHRIAERPASAGA